MFWNSDPPVSMNKRYFPSRKLIRNHILRARRMCKFREDEKQTITQIINEILVKEPASNVSFDISETIIGSLTAEVGQDGNNAVENPADAEGNHIREEQEEETVEENNTEKHDTSQETATISETSTTTTTTNEEATTKRDAYEDDIIDIPDTDEEDVALEEAVDVTGEQEVVHSQILILLTSLPLLFMGFQFAPFIQA